MNLKRTLKSFIENFNKLVFIKRKKKLEPYNIKSILVISLYFRGDFLFHTAFLQLLNKFLPGTKVDVWTKSRNRELASNNQNLNNLIIFDNIKTADYNDSSKLDIIGKIKFLKKIRNTKYDLVVDLTGKVSTALITYFSKSNYTIGINNYGFGAAYDSFVDLKSHNTQGHLITKYTDVLKYGLGINDNEWSNLTRNFEFKPYIYPSTEDKQAVGNILSNLQINKDKKLIVLHATAGWKAKEWDPNKFSSLIEEINARGYNFLFVGDDRDYSIFKFIIEKSSLMEKTKYRNHFLKLKMLQLAELINQSDVFIGSDSAPLHIAGAMGTPSIGLFGPTNPDFSNPMGKNHTILYHRLFCSASDNMQYCTRNAGKTCPTIDCMKMIEVNEVLNKIDILIEK